MSLRFPSRALRRLTAIIVVFTGWLYIIPQLHGAAIAISATTGIPAWLGPAIVILVVLPTVITGGMRSVTERIDRKSTRLNSSHVAISYAVFCLKKKTITVRPPHLIRR